MNFKTLPVLALLLCSGQIQAQGKVPKAPAATGWEDVVQQPIAQAVKLREAGKFEQARALLEAKLKTLHQPAHQRELRIALADVHFYWAKSLEARRSHAEAIRHYQAAYAIDRVLRRDDAGMDLQNIGNAYEVLGRYEEALRYYQQALPIRRETKNKRGEAITLISIGLAYKSLRRYEEALRYYQQALLIVREVEDRPGEGTTLNNIGVVYNYLSRHEEALRYYQQALLIYREDKDRREEAKRLHAIGKSYYYLNRYEEALRNYQQALPIHREAKDRQGEAVTLSDIGRVYNDLSHHQQALRYHQQALPITREVKDRQGQASTLTAIGQTYNYLSRYQEALRYFQQALPIYREVKDRGNEAVALNNIGLAYYRLSHYQEALRYYHQALSIARGVKGRENEAITLNNIGRVYERQNRHEEALRYLQYSLRIIREVKDRRGEAVVLRSLMSNWQLLRKPRLAIFYGKQSVNAFQEIRRGIQKLDKQTQQAFLQDNEDAYRTLADLLIAQGRLSEAQQVLGMLKEEELFQFVRRDPKAAPALSGTADLNAVEQQAEQQEQALSTSVVKMAAQLDALERLKSRTPAQDAQRTRLNAALNSARQKLAAFIEALPTRFEKGAQSATPNLNELQALQSDLRQLEKKTGVRSAILYTLVGAERTSVIFVGPAGPPVPFSFEIPSEKLNQKVFALRAALQNPRSDPRPLAQGMYEIVFCRGELEKQLEGGAITNLMWSLDGTLRYLPMPALHDGRKYLVERYSMSLWTLGSLARLKDEPQVPWRGLGLGVTQAHTVQTARFGRDSFQALSGVASELRSIVSDPETQGFSTGVLSGAVQMDGSFTKEALGQALREDYAVVHIASHFRLRPGNNADSYLLLGDGAALTLAEMSEMSNARPLFENVDLITLSACETALGGEATSGEAGVGAVGKANGAEVDSFGALAQQQGAGAVLATLWPVADQSTPLLMRAFYRERSEQPTLSKAEVLRRAQAALLTGQAPTPEATLASPASAQVLAPGPGPSPSQRSSRNDEDTPGSAAVPALRRDPSAPYAHPFFWAPFVLIGNWR